MRSIRQLLSAVVGTLVFAAAMFFAAGPASAHDVAESSSPAQGAAVATPPEKVSITFSKNPLGLGSQVKISDSTGTDWADGNVEIVDNVASQKLKEGAPAGEYTVTWRAVSSDSHPIEGTFTFTATAGAAGSTSGAPAPAAGTAQPGATTAPEQAPDASQPLPWSVVVFVLVAIGLLVTLGITAKRRLAPGNDDDALDRDELDRDELNADGLEADNRTDDDAGTTERRQQD